MGYDLMPKNKEAGSPRGMIFMWPQILNETGACYLLGYGDNTASPGMYVYNGSRGPGSPVSNDGFKVTHSEAKIMAKLFRGYVFVKKSIQEEWDKKTEEEKNLILSFNKKAAPPCAEFLEKIESLADFCEKSGGFRIR